jgi:predicted MPP superfamily phosphohydrolase
MTEPENPEFYRYSKKIEIDDPTQVQQDEQGRMRTVIQRDQCRAVIIHPSLGAPLLVEAGKPVSFFILADDKLNRLHRKSQISDQEKLEVRQIIALHTRYQLIDKSFRDKVCPVNEQVLIANNRDEVAQKLNYQFIGDIRQLSSRLRNFDNDKPFIGLLHPLAEAHFGEKGLRYLFEVTIDDLPLESGKLYDLSWIGYDEEKERDTPEGVPLIEWQDGFAQQFLKGDHYIGKPQHECSPLSPDAFGTGNGTTLESHHPVWVVPAGKPRLGIGQLSDVHVSSRQHAFRKSQARLIPNTSEPIGPCVNTSFDSLKDLMTQFGEDPDIDLLVFTGDLIDYGRNYNPSCLSDTRTGKLWQEMNLDKLNLRDDKGDPVRDRKDNLLPDTKRYPRGIDNAIVYSLLRWYMQTFHKPVLLTSGNHECYTLPYGISPRVRYTQNYKGMLPGHTQSQEEAVERTKAVRDENQAEQKRKGIGAGLYNKRANEGIAADHNLTIPEATLMYGPDYARVVFSGAYHSTGQQNFKAQNLDWFTIFYTPLSDYVLTWKEQCLMVLGWGNSEKFVAFPSDGQGLDFLSRASHALSDQQRDLVEAALAIHKPCNILCSHFTYANFEQKRPIKGKIKSVETRKITYQTLGSQWQDSFLKQKQKLKDEADAKGLELRYEKSSRNAVGEVTDTYSLVPLGARGQIDFSRVGTEYNGLLPYMSQHGPHDTGTFERHRHFLYSQLAENTIHYTLSGHSHRAGLYTPVKVKDYLFKTFLDIEVHADNKGIYPKIPADKTRMIVSACGGPIAIQNHDGELFNWGMDTPSGSYIKFSGSQEKEIGIKRSRVTQAKPRLCVALDYADLMCRDDHDEGIFTTFKSHKDDGAFTIEINEKIELPVKDWIESIDLHVFSGRSIKTHKFNLTNRKNQYSAMLNLSEDERQMFYKMREKNLYFLSIKPKQTLANALPADYDNSHPWVFQVDIISHTKQFEEALNRSLPLATPIPSIEIGRWAVKSLLSIFSKNRGFTIVRHEKYGEVPDLEEYSKIDPSEYSYPWSTKLEFQKKK